MKSSPIFIQSLEKQSNGKYLIRYTDSNGETTRRADLAICCFGQTFIDSDDEMIFCVNFKV